MRTVITLITANWSVLASLATKVMVNSVSVMKIQHLELACSIHAGVLLVIQNMVTSATAPVQIRTLSQVQNQVTVHLHWDYNIRLLITSFFFFFFLFQFLQEVTSFSLCKCYLIYCNYIKPFSSIWGGAIYDLHDRRGSPC